MQVQIYNRQYKTLMEKIKQEAVPDGYKMVSFDVKSPFRSVPLE